MLVSNLLEARIAARATGGLLGKTLVSGTGNKFRVTQDNQELDHVKVVCSEVNYKVDGVDIGTEHIFYNDAEMSIED